SRDTRSSSITSARALPRRPARRDDRHIRTMAFGRSPGAEYWPVQRGSPAMKPTRLTVAILSTGFLMKVPALAQPAPARPAARHFSNRILDDVVRMSHAGISDDSIIAYVRARMPRLSHDLTPEDLGSLQQAGVSENVVRFIAESTGM